MCVRTNWLHVPLSLKALAPAAGCDEGAWETGAVMDRFGIAARRLFLVGSRWTGRELLLSTVGDEV